MILQIIGGKWFFWPIRDVSLLEKTLVILSKEGIQQEGFNNLQKKRVSCRDQVLSSSLHFKGFDVNEEINNTMDGWKHGKNVQLKVRASPLVKGTKKVGPNPITNFLYIQSF
jgi:hypothetical protein